MTTLQYKGMETILQQIGAIQMRRRMTAIMTALIATTAIAIAALDVILPAAGLWPNQPPALFRWGMLFLLLGIWVFAVAWYLVRSLFWKETIAQTARQIEQVQPELRNDFINSILLSNDRQQVSPELVQLAIHEAARRSSHIDMSPATSMRTLRNWSIAAGAALLVLIGLKMFAPNLLNRGWSAIFTPTQHIATVGKIKIESVSPGDARYFVGEPVRIIATVDNPTGKDLKALLRIEGQEPILMYGDEENATFTFTDQARKDFYYSVEIEGTVWPQDKPYYQIKVAQKIDLQKLEVMYDYPEYTNLKSIAIEGKGDLEAIVGTKATVRVTLGEYAPSAWVDVRGKAPLRMEHKETPAGHVYERSFTIEEPGSYRIELRDSRNEAFQFYPSAGGDKGDYFTIKPLADRPPVIEFITPTSNAIVKAGGSLDTRIRVADDYGIADVKLYVGQAEDDDLGTAPAVPGEGNALPVSDLKADHLIGKDKGIVTYSIKVPKDLPEGAMMDFYATVTDNKPNTPQTTATYKLRITVQDAAKIAEEKAKQFEELRKRLFAMLEIQEHERVNTALAGTMKDLGDIQSKGREIVAGQTKLRELMVDLVEDFDFAPEMVMVQQAVAGMMRDEAPLAINQARVLTGLGAVRENADACTLLGRTQNRILSTLQGLLAIMPSLAKDKPDEKSSKTGTEMPQDVEEKLRGLRNDMDDLIEAQQKIIKDSMPLRKKPQDAFTPEDMALFEELKQRQDDWEKFMQSKFDDFSKIGEQDFSNPALMKEIIAVKSDITMAKDALKQKAEEIATALEDNGIENARTLKSNLEKWLPEAPDRTKWQMEDMLDQDNTEQPALPTELQDLMGDLLEEEEDLFDDMEDASGKFNQSGDAIGWDAAEGPISNENAQGVTGNALPNQNEMQGRAGQGRTGQSSGEMVEDKAVEKGGRKTPTRLGNEPFQQGKIEDKSDESKGGATGGGKIAGMGQQGLEGPLPPPLKEALDRIAGKQATLINKAERLQMQFDTADLSNFKLTRAIVLMNKVRDDLENGRYENALRAREAIRENLKDAKLHLTGDNITVRTDASAGMPKYVVDDMNDAALRNLPEEYKEALQEYFRKLNAGGDDEM